MKKITLIVIACVISASALKAQMEQGKLLVGLNTLISLNGTNSGLMGLGYSTTTYKSDADGFEEQDPDKLFSFNFSPKVGVFVVDGLAIGLNMYYGHTTETDGWDDDKYKVNLYSAGPFVRYYIPTSFIRPFIEVNGAYGSVKTKFESSSWDNDEYKASIINFGAGAGMAIPLGKKAAFDFMASYSQVISKATEDNDNNNRAVVGSIGLNIGFVLFLGRD